MIVCHGMVNGCSCQCFVSKQMPEKLGGFFVKICWYVLILAEATDQNTDVPKNWCRKPHQKIKDHAPYATKMSQLEL